MRRAALLLAATVTAACTAPPRELVAGLDTCEFCRMTVSDVRFGAQVGTRTGKRLAFDAVECVASYVLAAEAGAVNEVRVADFETGRLVPADSATFLVDSRLASPMGRSLVAFAARDGEALVREHGGRATNWSGVLAMVRDKALVPGADSSGAHAHGAHK